ncbi:PAS domain S-box protein [Sphingomonas sp. FW199]|uniref:PAS domain S-box protein n=1 Tax=Sphingomonas sp. FW199 TaxID=3400217 RepID=UPI003CE7EADB
MLDGHDIRAMGPVRRYGIAVATACVAIALRLAPEPLLGDRAYFLLFTASILVVAIFGGIAPAIFTAVLAGLFVIQANGLSGADRMVELFSFALTCGIILWIGHWVRSIERVSRENAARAERRANLADELAEELNLLIDGTAGYAIYMLDPQGVVTIWNKGAQRLKGWAEDEVIGRHCAIFYPEASVSAGQPDADLKRAADQGRFEAVDWRIRKDGSSFLAHVTVTALHGPDGDLRGFGKIVRDITHERASEQQIAASESFHKAILTTVPQAMVVADETGQILSFSAAAERLFGYCEHEVVGQNLGILMATADRHAHDGYIRHYLATGEKRIIGRGRVVLGQKRDGTTFPHDLVIGEVVAGERRMFIGFIDDLTEKLKADARIEELRSRLVHAARISAMGTMASTLAHELNQPITAVITFVGGVRNLHREGNADDHAMIEEGLDRAVDEALRAGSIVSRLREFVSRGDIEKTVEPLSQLIDDAAKLALIGARELGVEVAFQIDRHLDAVLVDRVQIQQVLINLIRNAVEAMAHSERRILTIAAATDDTAFVRVTVSDTGPGVAPEIVDHLFRAFNSTKLDGMGLGLSICRTIVEANGGRIWMEPVPAGGTAFHFTLVRADTEALA